MNIGNLINKKIIESKYENKKELYEAMKDIMGNECCAYNTFTEALSKNKSLSDKELLTLSVLLGLDLNKLALHYIKAQRVNLIEMNIEDYLKDNKESLLLYISYLLGDEYRTCKSNDTILSHINNTLYFLNLSKDCNRVVCYEINVKRNSKGHLLKVNQVANFSYFKNILCENKINVDDFMSFSFPEMIDIIKSEGDIYYDLYPETKSEIEDVYLEEFKANLLRKLIIEYIEENKEYIERTSDGGFGGRGDAFGNHGRHYISYMLESIIEKKALYSNGLLEMEDEAYSIFNEEIVGRIEISD